MVCIILFACSKSNTTNESSNCNSAISFSQTIQPILINNCTLSNCHDGSNLPYIANYNIAHDGAGQIRSSVASGYMPRGGTLSASDKSAILCWIDNGSKNN